jgi:hypothetical protein
MLDTETGSDMSTAFVYSKASQSATQIVAEIEATQKLLDRGWEMVKCQKCNGRGWTPVLTMYPTNPPQLEPCFDCDKRGHNWVPPKHGDVIHVKEQ